MCRQESILKQKNTLSHHAKRQILVVHVRAIIVKVVLPHTMNLSKRSVMRSIRNMTIQTTGYLIFTSLTEKMDLAHSGSSSSGSRTRKQTILIELTRQWLKQPKQETAHYFLGNGECLCGRSRIDLYSKTFPWEEGMLKCRNCLANMHYLNRCNTCKADLPEGYVYDCPLHGLYCKHPICERCIRTSRAKRTL